MEVVILCDSERALQLVKNLVYHVPTKHIDVQYHFVRDIVEDSQISLQKIHTNDNVVDMLTKPITKEKFVWCRTSLRLVVT